MNPADYESRIETKLNAIVLTTYDGKTLSLFVEDGAGRGLFVHLLPAQVLELQAALEIFTLLKWER